MMYLLFAGFNYYPCGGWDDFVGAYPTLEDARAGLRGRHVDWWHIVHGDEIVEQG